jgi:hypothetical protein
MSVQIRPFVSQHKDACLADGYGPGLHRRNLELGIP